ncbi:hypothetical protein SVAN01_05285 [Stagonosporopsis vannaccii]|nr:hypothetical protein SVAN01_05285 [Stagonosporopsis vannaccii]
MAPSYSFSHVGQATIADPTAIPKESVLHQTPQLVEQDPICQTPVKLSVTVAAPQIAPDARDFSNLGHGFGQTQHHNSAGDEARSLVA